MSENEGGKAVRALHRKLRALHAAAWEAARDVCVNMLIDSPDAFGETLEAIEARSSSEWIEFAAGCAEGREMSAFIAEDGEGVCGFVRGDSRYPGLPSGTVLVRQLWVAPRQRKTGLGSQLMNAVRQWATDRGLAQMVLGVMESNLQVREFYERLGYVDIGMRVPAPSNPVVQVVVMSKRLEKI